MDLQKQLFTGDKLFLGLIDYENDPQVMSAWTHGAAYMRLMEVKPVYPLSVGQVQKQLESFEKESEDTKAAYYFTVRLRQDRRLVGFAAVRSIAWAHGTAWLRLGIGNPADWRKGYGTEVLALLLGYAFTELNLYHLAAETIEYNQGARRLLEKAGFQQEVVRRKALRRDGRGWDVLIYGLLREDWEALNA